MRACKLCLAPDCEPAARSQGRDLLHCPACELVFVPEAEWVSLADERAAARKNRDWKKSDEIRDRIKAAGYQIEDTPQGQKITKA